MAIRLEYIIIIITIIISLGAYTIKLNNKNGIQDHFSKELQFKHSIFTEVTQKGFVDNAIAKEGIRISGILHLKDIRYHTNNIQQLRSNTAKVENERVYLDGNITMNQKKGFLYKAEHAYYDKKHKILTITSPFTAILNKNIIKGQSLEYDTVSKEAFATKIDAVIYTADK